MKRNQLLVLSALVAGLQIAVAQASPFPSAAEESYELPALETYADRMARIGKGDQVSVAHGTFPSAGEESYALPAIESRAERRARNGDTSGAEVWGVSRRGVIPHNPFPFGGGPVDD